MEKQYFAYISEHTMAASKQELLDKLKPCNLDEPYVFISYSSRDWESVFEDVIKFQEMGYNIWLDEKCVDKTKPSWKDSALGAIKEYNCYMLAFYVSQNSLTSQPCYNEVVETMSEDVVLSHFDPIQIICIDVDPISNIVSTSKQIAADIRQSDLEAKTKSSRTKVLSLFMKDVFNNNNERIRVHSKKDPDRSVDYYKDITQSFPKETRLFVPQPPKKEEKPAAEVKQEEKPAAEVKPAPKQEVKPAAEAMPAAKQEVKPAPAAAKPAAPASKPAAKEPERPYFAGQGRPGDRDYIPSESEIFAGIDPALIKRANYKNGNSYIGMFSADNKLEGKGLYFFASGNFYYGDFKNGTYDGTGVYYDAKYESRYTGPYIAGKRHGIGKLIYNSGNVYEGEFANDKRSGKGVFTWNDGSVYKGTFTDGKLSGKGTYTSAKGEKYVGDFVDGNYNGQGTYWYNNGDWYQGGFKDGNFNGKGSFHHADGTVFEATYTMGSANGPATKTFKNGSILKGNVTKGVFNGKCTYTAVRDGKKVGTFTGEMKNNKYEGWGRFDFEDGRWYEGSLHDNVPHGHGTYFIPAGRALGDRNSFAYYIADTRIEGDFINGKRGDTVLEIPHP